MTKPTNQEIFDKALFGIRQQNYAQSSKFSTCVYRGNNGTKCAVGHCIDDETAKKWDTFSDSSIQQVFQIDEEGFMKIFDESQIELLAALQYCHDCFLDVCISGSGEESFENHMKLLAQQFNLVYTPITETNL